MLMNQIALIGANLFFAGLLAGEEFVIRFGVRAPLAKLEPQEHIRLRQALIRRLRILVPAIFALAAGTGTAVVIMGAFDMRAGLPAAAVLTLFAFIALTLGGTVPINQAVLAWDPAAPPPGWRDAISRWERLDSLRTLLALVAFGLFCGATVYA